MCLVYEQAISFLGSKSEKLRTYTKKNVWELLCSIFTIVKIQVANSRKLYTELKIWIISLNNTMDVANKYIMIYYIANKYIIKINHKEHFNIF